uniref:Putative secreted protein n=1 Tax=Anopheles darlingi TaxID=43151 RepID=A0A2M4DNF1_ANODA
MRKQCSPRTCLVSPTLGILCSTAEHAVNAIRTIHHLLAAEWLVAVVVPEVVVPQEVTVMMVHLSEAELVVVCQVVVVLRQSS